MSVGLYPTPPNLAQVADVDPAAAFWVIKHGIKASGMPAWGKRMEDTYIWDMVALLRKLPTLSAEQYAAEVEASGGHSHDGGESASHSHAGGTEHDAKPDGDHEHAKPVAGSVHAHADGEKHEH